MTLVTIPSSVELLLVTSGSLRKARKFDLKNTDQLALAVVIPAHNEEKLVGRCVQSLRSAATRGPSISIVVVADNCTDSTAEIARHAGARVLTRENSAERGKGFALRFAFNSLMHEPFDAFLVVDADSLVSENLLQEVAGALLAGAQAVQTRYRVAAPLNTPRKRLMDVALLAFNVLRPRGRSAFGLSVGILGNGFALTRQTLSAVPYSADSIVEDLEYHLLLVQAGKCVVFVNDATVYGDMPEDEQARLSQRARWEGGRARVARMRIRELVNGLCRGRWLVLEPLIDLLTLPLAYLSLMAVLLSVMPVGAFRAYGIFLAGIMFAHVIASMALSGDMRECLRGLMAAPAYIGWKFSKIATIVRSSRHDAPWLRTGRASELASEQTKSETELTNV